MKTYVSYVVQDEKEHKHFSEIIEVNVNYCSRQMPEVIKWVELKQVQLTDGEKIILVNMFEI